VGIGSTGTVRGNGALTACGSPDAIIVRVRTVRASQLGPGETLTADSNRDGIPDLFQDGATKTFVHTEVLSKEFGDPTERLRKLSELKDAGLITEQEHEKKKSEILDKI
jgi:hypothetical protein